MKRAFTLLCLKVSRRYKGCFASQLISVKVLILLFQTSYLLYPLLFVDSYSKSTYEGSHFDIVNQTNLLQRLSNADVLRQTSKVSTFKYQGSNGMSSFAAQITEGLKIFLKRISKYHGGDIFRNFHS